MIIATLANEMFISKYATFTNTNNALLIITNN